MHWEGPQKKGSYGGIELGTMLEKSAVLRIASGGQRSRPTNEELQFALKKTKRCQSGCMRSIGRSVSG